MTRTVVVAIIAVVLYVSAAFAEDPAVLPDSIQVEILKLEAEGKFAKADSLKRQETAKAEVEARKAEAKAKLEKKEAEAKAGAEKKLWKEAGALKGEFGKTSDVSEIITKVDSPEKFAAAMIHFGIPKKAIDINAPSDSYADLLRTAAMIYHGTVQLHGPSHTKIAKTTTELGEKAETVSGAVVELAGIVEEHSGQIETLRQAVNENGVNTAACLDLLRSAKYNKSPKETDRVRRALLEAEHTYVPIEFEEVEPSPEE